MNPGTVRQDAGGWISGPSAMPWTTNELAAAAGVCNRTIYRWMAKGWLRGFRTSRRGHWRFAASEARQLLHRMGLEVSR